MRRVGTVSLLVAVAMLIGGVSQALLDEPPDAHLRHDGVPIQRAFEMARCWPGEDGGMGCSETRPVDWPSADSVDPGDRLRLRVDWKRKPRKIHIDDYKEVRNDGSPVGKGKDLAHKLIPVWRDGKIRAWNIKFRVFGERHHYVKVIVNWNAGIGVYGTHVKTLD